MMSSSDNGATGVGGLQERFINAQRQYQQLLDRVTPFVLYRWLGTAGLFAVFMLRILLAQGVSTLMHGKTF